MTPNRRAPQAEDPRDPVIEEAFRLLRQYARAPRDFHAQVMATLARQPASRGLWAWAQRGWSPAWAPVLATGLLLSLTGNAWLGYHALTARQQAAAPPVLEIRLTPRGPVEEPPAAVVRGDRYAAVGDYGKALHTYTAFLQAEGAPMAHVLRKMAEVYTRLRQYPQAIEAATAALALNADDALAYRYRGLAYNAVGDRLQAIRDLQRAVGLGDAEAHTTLRAWGVE